MTPRWELNGRSWRDGGRVAGKPAARCCVYAAALGGAAAITVALLWLLLHRQPYWMIDLEVYRAGAAAVRAGTPLYEVSVDNAVVRGSQFTYPPGAALAFLPLAWLSVEIAHLLFVAADTLALGAAAWLLLGMAGVQGRVRWTAVIMSAGHLAFPVLANTGVGQINTVLMLAVIVDLSGVLPRRWRGLLIGVAAGIKLAPLIFAGYLLAARQVALAARAGAAFATVTIAGWALLPDASRQYWVQGLVTQAGRVGVLNQVGNQSLCGIIARTGMLPGTGTWWIPVTVLTAAAGATAAGWAYRTGDDLAAMLIAAFTGVLAVPFAWPHHAVWVVGVLVWMGSRTAAGPARWVPAAAIGALLTQGVLFAVVAERWEFARDFSAGQQLLIAALGCPGAVAAAIVSAPWWLRRTTRSPESAVPHNSPVHR